jgi:hypothetical protein
VTARLAPTPHASIGVSYEQNELRGVGVDNVDTSADLYSIDGRFALDPQRPSHAAAARPARVGPEASTRTSRLARS